MKIKSIIRAGLVFLGIVFFPLPPLSGQSLSSIRTNSVTRGIIEDPILSRDLVSRPVITTVPRPQPSVRAADIIGLQQFNKLERELGVIKTNKMIWLEFDADAVFDRNRGTIKASGKSLLDKVLTYMALSGSQGIWVNYEFAASSESPETAQTKSENLVAYLKNKSGLSPGYFNIFEPTPLGAPAPATPRLYGQLQRPNRSVVNIRMQRSDI